MRNRNLKMTTSESNVSRDSQSDNDKSSIEVEMDGAANDSEGRVRNRSTR